MITEPTLEQLIHFHTEGNIGAFGSQILSINTTTHYSIGAPGISDCYWNYAYRADGQRPKADMHQSIKQAAISHSIEPVILHFENDLLPVEKLIDKESWMLKCINKEHKVLMEGVQVETFSQPSREMINVFLEAYGEPDPTSDTGYSGLPEAYASAYAKQTPPPGYNSVHMLVLSTNGRSLGIASAIFNNEIIGVYSVGVRHDARRRGIGRFCTEKIVQIARESSGAKWSFLQTEANSEVETLYRTIGYRVKATAIMAQI